MSGEDYEDDYYGDEFEDAENEIKSPKTKFQSKTPIFDNDDYLLNGEENQEDEEEEEEEEKDVNGLDLENYMMGMKIIENEDDQQGVEISKVAQPLEGVYPKPTEPDQLKLVEKLGYSEGFTTSVLLGSNSKVSPIKKDNFDYDAFLKQHQAKNMTQESPEDQRHHSSQSDNNENRTNHEADAAKVDALLAELFPDKYGKKKKIKKVGNKKNAQANDEDDYETRDEEANGVTSNVLDSLDGQLKLLKKELKIKDDKIVRLSDHCNMMANQLDRYKGEVARLNAKLKDAETEIELKNNRITEMNKMRKKAKKASQQEQQQGSSGIDQTVLEVEYVKLKEREQALLEAVEELSSQNEDLIIKLRESMQRELELSSKRAALVSNIVSTKTESTLPNIFEKDSHAYHAKEHSEYGMVRAQTEPSIESAPKRVSKKKKKLYA